MASFSKQLLSGSTGGKMVKVGATATPGTTIHTTGISAANIDEVWLYAVNSSATVEKLTIEYGGTTSPDDLIEMDIPSENGLYLVVAGLILTGDGSTGRTIRAFAGTADVINIAGYVNRIS